MIERLAVVCRCTLLGIVWGARSLAAVASDSADATYSACATMSSLAASADTRSDRSSLLAVPV